MKKYISLLLLAGVVSGQAAITQFDSLLSGYNLLVGSNTTATAGFTNNLYTDVHGAILYSMTNNMGQTNIAAGDAFSVVTVYPDANGDINANAALMISVGNTNLIPIVTTNLQGQFIIPPAGFINAQITTAYGGWPLAYPLFPTYQYPATTNVYSQITQLLTNFVTVSLYRAVNGSASTGSSAGVQPLDPRILWETTAGFTVTFNENGVSPVTILTNLPTGFLQGAKFVKATVTVGATNNVLVNLMGISQPVP